MDRVLELNIQEHKERKESPRVCLRHSLKDDSHRAKKQARDRTSVRFEKNKLTLVAAGWGPEKRLSSVVYPVVMTGQEEKKNVSPYASRVEIPSCH